MLVIKTAMFEKNRMSRINGKLDTAEEKISKKEDLTTL